MNLLHEGADIVIEMIDDGAGVPLDAVRRKAIKRGLLDPQADLSDHEILQFILRPGFSTAEKITQISGRGLGMDVVHEEVKQLGGSMSIESAQGKGARFLIRLPFTVSINRVLMVHLGEEQYAIPLNTIEASSAYRRQSWRLVISWTRPAMSTPATNTSCAIWASCCKACRAPRCWGRACRCRCCWCIPKSSRSPSRPTACRPAARLW